MLSGGSPLYGVISNSGHARQDCTLASSLRQLSPAADKQSAQASNSDVPIGDICSTANCDYSITSSARASSIGGTSMPSALAVLRLITSSYLVGACTGRSAGFSPLSTRSTYDAPRR